MKLIIEEIYDTRCFTEDKEGDKHLFIEGPFLVGDKPNKNHRVYPWSILEAKADKYITEYVQTRRAFGELGHPDGPRINPERISHLIVDLKKDGTQYIGKARINEEGLGKIAHGIINMGGMLGASSRAVGSLKMNKETGINEVQNDLLIATAADLVVDPSAPGAFVNGIYEGSEWVWDNGMLKESTVQDLKNQVDKAYSLNKRERDKAIVETFERFMSELSKVSNI